MGIPWRRLNTRSGEVVYQRVDGRNNYQMIAIDRLVSHCNLYNYELSQFPLVRNTALHFKQNRNIEQQRLLNLYKHQEYAKLPVIAIKDYTLPVEHQVDMIDGHHRYVLRYLAGHAFITGWVLEPTVWKQFLVKGYPAHAVNNVHQTGSGINYGQA